jgi:hypothetical protein
MPGVLSIFDFDDTLITSTAKVLVTHKDGTEEVLDSAEYAKYRAQPGDEFDYGDFEKYPPGAEPIGSTFRALESAIAQSGPANVVILTARSADRPVRKYLKDQGISGVEIQAIGDANPMAKARYVVDRLKDGDYDVVHVYEDNAQNIRAIEKVVTKAGVKFKSTMVMAEALEDIRSLIREHLLTEDPMGFVHDLAKSDKFGDQFFGGKVNKAGGREIKRAFADNADHEFLKSLNTVHWTTTYSLKGLGGKGKDELSATMSLPGEEFVPAANLEVGLWVKGRITLATNDQDMMYSGFHGDYGAPHEGSEEEVTHRDKSSGRNKRPSVSKDFSRYGQLKRGNDFHEKMARNMAYILDQSTFHQAAATWGGNVNVALVDNWKPHAIVIDQRHSGPVEAISDHPFEEIMELTAGTTKQIFSLANEMGIPIVDLGQNELWSPE